MAESDTYDGDKSPQQIEEDIARTRVRLSATIEALERELAPARAVEKTADMLRSALEPAPGPFRQQLWAYAIPLALIATGLGWLFALRRRSFQAPPRVEETLTEQVELGETPVPAPSFAAVVEPAEPLSVGDERTSL
ncbi:MAG: DUF3618 domain-containing protein [Stellaceae bacterium]